jgi:hypothetical protein|tara:strand:- start:336 stop:500 length:165 start_codon:yes stop_codon:yes gene_type:complete
MNIQKMNVTELNSNEFKQVNGGNWFRWGLTLLGAMINDAQNNPDDFQAGMSFWE